MESDQGIVHSSCGGGGGGGVGVEESMWTLTQKTFHEWIVNQTRCILRLQKKKKKKKKSKKNKFIY